MSENPYKSPEAVPGGAPAIPADRVQFHPAVRPQFLLILGPSLTAGLVWGFCLRLILDGLPLDLADLIAFPIASLTALVLSFIGAWVVSVLFSDMFSALGVYGHSFWGARRFVRWQDVTSAQPIGLSICDISAFMPANKLLGLLFSSRTKRSFGRKSSGLHRQTAQF